MSKLLAFVISFYITALTIYARPLVVQPINAVLGDVSFSKTFDMVPSIHTNEQLRIRTHLAYVEQLLRIADVKHLSSELRTKRIYLLDKLHEYWVAGQFPKNLDYPNERRPCFIDKFGYICAVGYLLEQDAGREVAEFINTRAKYSYIQDMDIPELHNWVKQSGFTALECAMIQPGYQSYIPDDFFTIESMTPTSTSANAQLFTMTFVVDGIPTTATVTTNPFTFYSFGAAFLPPPAALNMLDWANQYSVILQPQSFYLSSSQKYPGRTQGTLIFQGYGSQFRAVEHQAFVFYREPTPRGLGVFTQKNYHPSKPLIFQVSSGTSNINNEKNLEFLAFPNPVTNKLTIQHSEQISRLRLLTILGIAVFDEQNIGIVNNGARHIDASTLPQGIYFLEVSNGIKRSLQKIVKE